MIPWKVPSKIVTCYDEGTPDQQYITTYTDTVVGALFHKLVDVARKLPGQAEYVRNPLKMVKIAEDEKSSTWRYPDGWVPHHYNRKWGYLVESYGDKITFLTPKYAHRVFRDWYGGSHGRTLIYEKNRR